jgi:FlaA1/EpsC-like NDP-sugar epimerase
MLDWSGFLARPELSPPSREMLQELSRAPVLVAGAGGSIGSALAHRLAALAPVELVLLEAAESSLQALQRDWAAEQPAPPAVFRLGSVGDRALLQEIFDVHAPRLVFHAAAFKHVPLLEAQPLAAMENNIFGTLALVEAAAGARVILLSTDKAVEPVSVMGATKRIAEQIVLSAGGTVVRLGNVLGSRGSVVEVFASQIAAGGPLTITAPGVTRYFLTVGEAVNVLLFAALEHSPALLAPALPRPHKISALAHFMAKELAAEQRLSMVFTGLRAGEKESEDFWSATESAATAKTDGLLRIDSPLPSSGRLRSALAQLRSALDGRDLGSAVDCLQALVPEYTPSPALLSLIVEIGRRVSA